MSHGEESAAEEFAAMTASVVNKLKLGTSGPFLHTSTSVRHKIKYH